MHVPSLCSDFDGASACGVAEQYGNGFNAYGALLSDDLSSAQWVQNPVAARQKMYGLMIESGVSHSVAKCTVLKCDQTAPLNEKGALMVGGTDPHFEAAVNRVVANQNECVAIIS